MRIELISKIELALTLEAKEEAAAGIFKVIQDKIVKYPELARKFSKSYGTFYRERLPRILEDVDDFVDKYSDVKPPVLVAHVENEGDEEVFIRNGGYNSHSRITYDFARGKAKMNPYMEEHLPLLRRFRKNHDKFLEMDKYLSQTLDAEYSWFPSDDFRSFTIEFKDGPSKTFEINKPYRNAVKAFNEHREEEQKRQIIAAARKLRDSNLLGQIRPLVLAAIIQENDDFMTFSNSIKIARGLSVNQYTTPKQTVYGGRFNAVPADDFEKTAWQLSQKGFIQKEYAKGKYASYHKVHPTMKSRALVYIGENIEEAIQQGIVSRESVEKWELSRVDKYRKKPSKNEAIDDLEYLISHREVWCWDEEASRKWISQLPQDAIDYLKLRYKIEDDRRERKYLKMMLECIEGK